LQSNRLFDPGEKKGRMIPRHGPRFGLGRLISIALFHSAVTSDELESACAEMLGVRNALLLPSARAGILLALKAVVEPSTAVVGPAYVCGVVHEAMILSGATLRFADATPGGFLMDAANLPAAQTPCVQIFSDIYGLPCDREAVKAEGGVAPLLRLWDMAMSVPQADAFSHMQSNDAALLSFGLGKCLYAGWGGALLSNDSDWMGRVRDLRDRWISQGNAVGPPAPRILPVGQDGRPQPASVCVGKNSRRPAEHKKSGRLSSSGSGGVHGCGKPQPARNRVDGADDAA
jgi:dTDP-4-amino-4,6-dideoxygalactose transaminase